MISFGSNEGTELWPARLAARLVGVPQSFSHTLTHRLAHDIHINTTAQDKHTRLDATWPTEVAAIAGDGQQAYAVSGFTDTWLGLRSTVKTRGRSLQLEGMKEEVWVPEQTSKFHFIIIIIMM